MRGLSKLLVFLLAAGMAFFAACDTGGNVEFAISFSANGGTGAAPNPILAAAGASVTLPGQGALTHSTANFVGWNTNAAGTGTSHNPGATIPMPSGNITLYANWSTLPPLTGSASITGNAWVGGTLTADTSNLHGSGAFSFEWRRGGTPIAGATGSSYLVQNADVGNMIIVNVSRANNSGSVTSNAVGPVTAAPNITWTATSVGSPTTTAINFTFSADPGTMQASDFTIAPGTGSATRGALSGTGTTRTLAITDVSVGTVSVSINRTGVASEPQTVELSAPITWNVMTVMPRGSLLFTFSADPGPMVATDFTITPIVGQIMGVPTLSGTGTTRTLFVSVWTPGLVWISINRAGVASEPRSVSLW